MKKMIRLLQFIFSFSCVFLLACCRNSTGGNVENKTIIFNGSFEVQESLLRQIDTSSYTANDNSRSAQPSLPASLTFYAKATNKNDSTDFVESEDLDSSNKTFSIPLKTGAVWIIEVGAKGDSALTPSVTETDAVLIKDTFEFNPATAAEPRVNHKFYLVPYVTANGKGYLNLQIQIENPSENKISKVEIVPKKNIIDESKKTAGWNSVSGWDGVKIEKNAATTISLSQNNFTSGVWEVAINFTDEYGQLLFSSTQIIGVYDNLKTDKWESSKTTASSNELIKNGVFKLTTQLVDAYGLTDFYVGGTGASDTNSGSPMYPLATISKAISIVNGINRMDKTYTIHVENGVSEECAGQLDVKSNISIECYETIYGDKKGSATISSASPAAIIYITSSDVSSSSLTIEGVKIANGWSGLKLMSSSNRDRTISEQGVYINTNCSFFMNGGEISGYINGSTSANGPGVYVSGNSYFTMTGGKITNFHARENGGGVFVLEDGDFTMKGGKITNNKAYLNGGGVNVAGTMTMSGIVDISDNIKSTTSDSSNIYLPTGKLIKVNGSLDGSTIGITTQDTPSVGNNIRFTDGYAYAKEWGQNGNNHPYKYFNSDRTGFSILTDPTPDNPATPEDENNGDAYLGVSGGLITKYVIPTITISFTKNSNTEYKISATCSETGWEGFNSNDTTVTLQNNGVDIPAAFWSYSHDTHKLTLQNTLPSGNYVIQVNITYAGYYYTGTYKLTKS